MNIKEIYRFLSTKHQNVFLEYKVNPRPRFGHGAKPHDKLYDIINNNRDQYKALLNKALLYSENIQQISENINNENLTLPNWRNDYLPGLDIVGVYTMLAELNPAKYIEIGSGNSTKVAHKAKVEQKLKTEIISIDPYPRTEIDKISDKIIREPFENIDFEWIKELKEGDILFVDNSHRILPNSDSMVFYLELLPYLRKGVIVHIHDIYIPFDYPQFMCDRFYSEQYGLAMFLLANPEKYKPILPNYFISEDPELSALIEPIWNHDNLMGIEKHGGSFWFEIK